MKTYSETMKSVLEKAAVITEEKQEKAKKTRSRLKTVLGAALAFALIIGAVLVIKPFGERGNGGQLGYGADSEKSTPAVEETPSCGGDPDFTSEPAEPSFITEKTEVIWNDDTYALNIDRFLTMLEADGYINVTDGVKHKDYDIENSDFCNLTPDYFCESFPEIEVFCDQEHRGRAYFLRFGDKLYCYEGITINNMCLWDYDGSGVDDLALRLHKFSDEGIAYQWIECLDAVTGELKPIFARRADFTSSRFVFDYDGKSIYVDKLLLEYRDGQAYIGTRLAADHAPSFDWAEHELISSERISVKEYANGSSENVELAFSILRSSGFILKDGRRYTELDIGDIDLRNCTSDYVIEKTDDIELFYNYHDWCAYFIRVGNELYRHDAGGGHHIYMLLWDYDKNGVEDVVMVSEAGSGTTYQEAVVFDVSTKEFKDIIHRNIYTDINFTFHFDGENIYIYLKKVEYKGGEFLIDGIIVQDYNPVLPTKEPEITPEPTPSVSISPRFFTRAIMVKSYDEGDELNSELALSMLRSNRFIIAETGESCIDFDDSDTVLRNCTSDYVREHAPDIELFQNKQYGSYFIRIGDKLYSYNSGRMGDYIQMCLWDYDNNGVDDIVLCSTSGSGILYLNTEIFDVTTKAVKKLSTVYLMYAYMFELQFDGSSIYIDKNKVEYVDGEFYIGGMKAEDYRSSQFEPKNTPKPSDHPSYAYPDILCIAPDDFSFTIQWGVGAYSSYDSKTGRLVKTTDTTHPEDYVTELFLSEYEINRFYTFITWHIDIFELPDEYDPINDPSSESKIQSEPYETIILTVHADGREKTVTCPEIPLGEYYGYCYEAYTFYNLGVRFITDIIMNSPEWQALPEYEFFYE